MKSIAITFAGLLIAGLSQAQPQSRFILRTDSGEGLATYLTRYNLRVENQVPGQPVFAVSDTLGRSPQVLLELFNLIEDDGSTLELDQVLELPILRFRARQNAGLNSSLFAFYQGQPTSFFGNVAPRGALIQPAVSAIDAGRSWTSHGIGTGIVAVIDTGIDPNHPFFAGKLLPGIDYLTPGGTGSEMSGLPTDVLALINPTTTPLLQQRPTYTSFGTAPMLNFNAATDPRLSRIPIGLGHGTMVAGAVRLVAPGAKILPIRAFQTSGTGRLFDVIRGIYAAEQQGAKVINLSFNTYTFSPELSRTVEAASDRGLILVASTGNDGLLDPASYPASINKATGVGSIGPTSTRSFFSNFGVSLTTVVAPGEAMMLPFPGNRWAAGWGTSFSAPLVSGLAAKMLGIKPSATYSDLQSILSKSRTLNDPSLGFGRLNIFESAGSL